jgi:hypothetical protein
VSVKRIVIDASAALKWRLRNEEATSQADALLDDFLTGKLELLTPTLFDYEVANALRVAVTRQRLSEQDAATALADFFHSMIKFFDLDVSPARGVAVSSDPAPDSAIAPSFFGRPFGQLPSSHCTMLRHCSSARNCR